MHIACPNCQAVYDVPDDKLAAAALLRCHLCEYSWVVNAPKAAAQQAAPAQETVSPALQIKNEPAPAAETFQPHQYEPLAKSTNHPSHSFLNSLLVVAALILVVLTVALLDQQQVLKAWPASAAFFKALGIS